MILNEELEVMWTAALPELEVMWTAALPELEVMWTAALPELIRLKRFSEIYDNPEPKRSVCDKR